jgi:hypothetical protein
MGLKVKRSLECTLTMGCYGRCGREFVARRPWHRVCEGCYRGRRPRWHLRMAWLEHPELALLVTLLGWR